MSITVPKIAEGSNSKMKNILTRYLERIEYNRENVADITVTETDVNYIFLEKLKKYLGREGLFTDESHNYETPKNCYLFWVKSPPENMCPGIKLFNVVRQGELTNELVTVTIPERNIKLYFKGERKS